MPQQPGKPLLLSSPSRVIPIECPKDDDDNPPPEWAMIELNGELIAPTEFPTNETCQTVLCGGDRVELGRLQLSSDNKVNNKIRVKENMVRGVYFFRAAVSRYSYSSPAFLLTYCTVI
jgi:hypothetical protein